MNVASGNSADKDQDFEINIASIIDCFTVLITYLLVSTSFLAIGAFDVSMATPGPVGEDNPPRSQLRVDLAANRTISVAVLDVNGTSQAKLSIPAREGSWDYEGLERVLIPIRERMPELEIAQLSASPTMVYSEIVRAVERLRRTVPAVYFSDQGGE